MKVKALALFAVLLISILAWRVSLQTSESLSLGVDEDRVDFNFHVKPVLVDRCYECHGPDENTREADLRLDQKEGVFGDLGGGYYPVVAGKPDESEMIWRLFTEDEDDLMPPPDSGHALTQAEKEIIRKWVEQGAEWKAHWSFEPPRVEVRTLAELKKKDRTDWQAANPIDHFVYKKLQEQGLSPSPEADKEHLIRRVSFDLTGLPPSLEEIDDFLNDDSPDAYEKLVDRLMQTEEHAERMATEWLDVARYGDSQGLHADRPRYHWPWRDWVIKAFHENMPYDDFITWQMAGDLLPNATTEQKLATAFHRNHPVSAEGGIVDEEYRVKYVHDRTNTTATAFMGLTMECASCHDHKFDPISQEEYYQLSAFFNNQREIGMVAEGGGSSGPVLLLPDPEQESQIANLVNQIESTLEHIKAVETTLGDQPRFLETARNEVIEPPEPDAFFPLDSIRPEEIKVKGFVHRTIRNTPIDNIVDDNPTSVASGNPEVVEGRIRGALDFDEEYDLVFLRDVGQFELDQAFSAGAWIRTNKEGENQSIMGISGELTVDAWRGWDLFLDEESRPSIRLIGFWPHNHFQVTAEVSVTKDEWHHILFTYDGSGSAGGAHLYVNGQKAKSFTVYDNLYRTIIHSWEKQEGWNQKPVMVGRSGRFYTGDNGVFEGSIDHIQLFHQYLTPPEVAAVFHQDAGTSMESVEISKADYIDHHLHRHDEAGRKLVRQLRALTGQKLEVVKDVTEIMVMEEMPVARKTFVLNRGQYNSPANEVSPGTPQKVLPFGNEYPQNRLGLARWLLDSKNPLTARVAVNRYWQMIFGRGIVDTPEDFGTQGALPTHPELLDWLAVYFRESGWDVRGLLRTMVTSNTYRQSSVATARHWEKDPQNIYLARGSSHRLPAEMIRDNALKASGLLVQQVGGPSVKPYQPSGIWMRPEGRDWEQDSGDKLYRRSMYTYIRRSTPHPAMLAFDAPNRAVCTVKRENTTTPLQALVLMNDPQFMESARVLAQRIQREGGESVENQLTYAFRLLCGRYPEDNELQLLLGQFQAALERYRADPESAEAILAVGEFPLDETLDKQQTAALTLVANTVMNFDGFYMKR